MPRALPWVLAGLLCLPLLMVALLLVSVQARALDGLTLRMPMGWRAVVSELVERRAVDIEKDGWQVERALRLDPEDAAAWRTKCLWTPDADRAGAKANCTRALALEPNAWVYNRLGLAQMNTGNACTAEETFTAANTMLNAGDTDVLRNMSEAARGCGHLGAAAAGFDVAAEHDAKDATDGDSDDEMRKQAAVDLNLDRRWLALVYGEMGQGEEQGRVCAALDAGWKGCRCAVKGGVPECVGVR